MFTTVILICGTLGAMEVCQATTLKTPVTFQECEDVGKFTTIQIANKFRSLGYVVSSASLKCHPLAGA